jgi:5-oxoprolinase (ATP-hydrolysing)
MAAGSLVANAPHLPVHLGAMSEAVRFQVAYYGPGGQGQEEGLQVICGSSSSSKSVKAKAL